MPEVSAPDFSGETIYKRFEMGERQILRPQSSLYQATDTRTQERVHVEILHATAVTDANLAGRFQRRIEIVSQLKHPSIAPILQTGQTQEKRPFAVIEHVPGRFLEEMLPDWESGSGKSSPLAALTLVRHLANALAVAHPAGIIHHYLHPKNIYVQEDGTPLLLDLGAVIVPLPYDESRLGQTGRLDYASPEQLRGQALTGRSNIFSLGVLLYRLLAGDLPELPLSDWDIFDRRALPKEIPLEEARAGLAPATYQLVKNCLWQQEWNRFDTTTHMVDAIEKAIAAELRASAQPRYPLVRSSRRFYLVTATIVLLVAVAAVAAFYFLR